MTVSGTNAVSVAVELKTFLVIKGNNSIKQNLISLKNKYTHLIRFPDDKNDNWPGKRYYSTACYSYTLIKSNICVFSMEKLKKTSNPCPKCIKKTKWWLEYFHNEKPEKTNS